MGQHLVLAVENLPFAFQELAFALQKLPLLADAALKRLDQHVALIPGQGIGVQTLH
jgi:hypothetical protein